MIKGRAVSRILAIMKYPLDSKHFCACVPLEEEKYGLLCLRFMTQGPEECASCAFMYVSEMHRCQMSNLEILNQGFHLIMKLFCTQSCSNTAHSSLLKIY